MEKQEKMGLTYTRQQVYLAELVAVVRITMWNLNSLIVEIEDEDNEKNEAMDKLLALLKTARNVLQDATKIND